MTSVRKVAVSAALVCSVALNAYLMLRLSSPAPAAIGSSDVKRPAVASLSADMGEAVSASQASAAGEGRLSVLVADLRSRGCSDREVRAMIRAFLREQEAREIAALLHDVPFWEHSLPPDWVDAFQEIKARYQAVLEAELGRSYTDSISRSEESRVFGNLSTAKMEAVARIRTDYAQMKQKLAQDRSLVGGNRREVLARMDEEYTRDLAAVLTVKEMEEYLVRSSPTAIRLKQQISGLGLSESEYRGLYALQKRFEDERRYTDESQNFIDDPSYQAELNSLLGPVRMREFLNAAKRRERQPNQALQTTPMTRSGSEKTIEFGRPQRGV